MEEDLLQTVIKVESEIQHSIESERKKAAEWLESVRVSLSQELEAKKRQLDDDYSQSLDMTYKKCEFKAKKEIENANQMAENLQNLPEDILHNTVKKFLREILPAVDG